MEHEPDLATGDLGEQAAQTVPMVHPKSNGVRDARDLTGAHDTGFVERHRVPRWRRVIQAGVALGVAGGVGVGVAALASAATTSTTTPGGSSSTTTPSTTPQKGAHPGFRGGMRMGGGPGFGGFGGLGGFGPVLHGTATVKGPNGYETIEVQTGTVTSVKDVSGSTWSLVVTSADKTAITYTVDSGTSVNGGEMGIASVKTGDTVDVMATVSKGTSTVKSLMDTTQLKNNRSSWAPSGQGTPPGAPANGKPSSSTGWYSTSSGQTT